MYDRWWQQGVIYQVYTRSFQDSDGDGVGDLPGVTRRLGYLAWLGVDAVWINPFYRSPMKDFGYDTTDHEDVDPLFGTLEDFDRLVERAHRLGLKAILDYVPNHTSDEHPWFVESRSSRENPKRDWYVWRDPKPDCSPPNNWISPFGGSQWAFDRGTGQYYLHTFHEGQPDLNWRNPRVEEAMFWVARFWLERGVDGFRVDVANFVMKDPLLRDNPPNPSAGTSSYKYLGSYDTQVHLYDKGHPDVHPLYRRFRRLLDSYSSDGSEKIAMGEVHNFEWPEWTKHWAAYYGENLDELHMPLNFTLVGLPWEAERFRWAVDEVEAALPDGARPNLDLGSHDEPRVASRVGAGRARAAMMLLLTLRGAPIVYYGDELGMEDVPVLPGRAQDPFGEHDPALGRDPERTPMQWDAGPNAGFCGEGVEPWLPVAEDHAGVNAAQREDPRSVLSLFRRLAALRRELSALAVGSYCPLGAGSGEVFAYLREHGGQRALVALNFGTAARRLDLSAAGARGELLCSTGMNREGALDLRSVDLGAYEGLVVLARRTGSRERLLAVPRATDDEPTSVANVIGAGGLVPLRFERLGDGPLPHKLRGVSSAVLTYLRDASRC
jgi:alpha-glucosidase